MKKIVEDAAKQLAQELTYRNFLNAKVSGTTEVDSGWYINIASKRNISYQIWGDLSFRDKLLWVGVYAAREDQMMKFMGDRLQANLLGSIEDGDPYDQGVWKKSIIQAVKRESQKRLGPQSFLFQEKYRGEHYLGALVVPNMFSASDAADLCEFLDGSGALGRTLSAAAEAFYRDVVRARTDLGALEQRLRVAPRNAARVQRVVLEFARNPDVVAMRLHMSGGICGGCRKKAPFMRKSTSEPYLEVHHVKPLALGGEDTAENTIALCPNCHRERHFGE